MIANTAQNYYERLGLDPEASPDLIKAAYRTLSKKFHPDLNDAPDAEEQYILVQEAYETLRQPERRAAYDASLQPDDVWSEYEDMPNDVNDWDFVEPEPRPQAKPERSTATLVFLTIGLVIQYAFLIFCIWWPIKYTCLTIMWIIIGIYWLIQLAIAAAFLMVIVFPILLLAGLWLWNQVAGMF